jgi:putative two-component system response regulator
MGELRESHERLSRAHRETLDRLGRASQWRDDETGFHIRRIGLSSAMIGRAMGLTSEFVDMLEMASPMHDIGKIGIPDYILLKQGKLTPVEFEVMKTHTIIGAQILGGSETPMLQVSARIAMTHHERWDGTGYPRGLAGKAIPLEGLIVAVADACDALRHERSYKSAFEPEVCVETLRKDRGTHFAPDVFDAFLMVADEIFSLDKQLINESPRNRLIEFGSLGELNEMNIEQFKSLIQTISTPQTPLAPQLKTPGPEAGVESPTRGE